MAYNERDFQTAIVCGLMSKGRELKGNKAPIAYLYNGVQLPKLPEWDKSKYPYAVIVLDINDIYNLFISTKPIIYAGLSKIASSGAVKLYKHQNDTWNLTNDYGEGAWSGKSYVSPKWSNPDLLYGDYFTDKVGTVFLTASEPIPVYE